MHIMATATPAHVERRVGDLKKSCNQVTYKIRNESYKSIATANQNYTTYLQQSSYLKSNGDCKELAICLL